jgi:hypothetical protein
MPATYEPISTQTLGSNQTTVTLSSIPATYTDLILIFDGTSSSAGQNFNVRYNSDTATNYSERSMIGNGSTAASYESSSQTLMVMGGVYASQGTISLHIFNYANTTTFKTTLGRTSFATGFTSENIGLWRKTPEAINTITLTQSGGANFLTGSTFTLYGIKAA